MQRDSITDECLKVACELIKFRSTEDRPEQIKECMEYIKSYFSDSNVKIREYEFAGKPSLFISFNKRNTQDLILNGHIDVVEGTDHQFDPVIKEGHLIGRGSSDMKAAVAVMMVLMKELSKKNKKPSLGLMIVSDEEIGGANGTAKMMKKGFVSKFALTGETSKFNVETKHKGMMSVKVVAYGSASHGSRPWLGSNAIEKLIKQLQALKEAIPQATAKHKWFVSINPTSFVAKSTWNVTPSKAEMVLDIRTTEDFTSQKVLNVMKKLKMKYKRSADGKMLLNNKKNEHIRSLKRITQKVLGRKVKYIKSCGGSDTRFFSDKGIPAVNFGPIGMNHHKRTEYLEISSIKPYYDILDQFIKVNF